MRARFASGATAITGRAISGGVDGWVITEQVRTVSAHRFRRHAPEIAPSEDELAEIRQVLAQILTA